MVISLTVDDYQQCFLEILTATCIYCLGGISSLCLLLLAGNKEE
jgi:hypothetical protein